jgi:hypothetical protein
MTTNLRHAHRRVHDVLRDEPHVPGHQLIAIRGSPLESEIELLDQRGNIVATPGVQTGRSMCLEKFGWR